MSVYKEQWVLDRKEKVALWFLEMHCCLVKNHVNCCLMLIVLCLEVVLWYFQLLN